MRGVRRLGCVKRGHASNRGSTMEEMRPGAWGEKMKERWREREGEREEEREMEREMERDAKRDIEID